MKNEFDMKKGDENADRAVKVMMGAVAAAAIVPAHVNWALTAAAIGTGCAAIGGAYGIGMTKDEGWMLGKQFLIGAGSWFLAMNVGVKLFAAIAESTGIGYVAGAAIDAAFCSASAWAIGGCAKSYFRNMALGKMQNPAEFGKLFREMYKAYKNGTVKAN